MTGQRRLRPPASEAIVVPRAAVPFILLQRPMLQRFQVRSRQVRMPFGLSLRLEALIRRRSVTRQFVRQMTAEFESVVRYLPADAKDVVDLGCGVAAIDVLLFRHYGGTGGVRLHLVDRSERRSEPRYGFAARDEYYNSLAVTRTLLRANGVAATSIHCIEVGETGVDSLPHADLILSLASWGFHYPVSTYLEPAWRALRPDGVLILDVRRGTGGEAALESRFARIVKIQEVFNGRATRFQVHKSA